MHDINIIHLDIKADNVVIDDKEKIAKVIDYTLSIRL